MQARRVAKARPRVDCRTRSRGAIGERLKVNRAGGTGSVADEICLVDRAPDAACGAGAAPGAGCAWPGIDAGRALRPTRSIEFSADQVTYDSDADIVTATGDVRMNARGQLSRRRQVVWDRKSGEVRAKGNVVVVTPQGDKLIGDNVVLTDTLRDGTIDNLLVVLESGGRIAAAPRHPQRRCHDARKRDLFALPGDHLDGLPQAAELGDHGGQGDRRPGSRPRPFRRRPAADCSGSTCRLLPIFNISDAAMAARPAGSCPTSAFRPARASSSRCPITGRSVRTATRRSRRTSTPACCRRSKRKYRELNSIGAFQLGGFLTYGTIENVDPDATVDPQGRPRLFRSQRQIPARPGVEHHRLAPGRHRQDRHPPLRHHQRRPAAQASSTSSGSARTATSRSPAGRSRACASTTCRSKSRSLCRRSTRASGSSDVARRQGRAPGQQPVDPAHRGTGHAARLRQRAVGPAAADAVGPGGDVDRLRPRRRLSYRRRGEHAGRRSIAAPTAGMRARIGALAADVKWPFVGPLLRRHPAARPAGPVRADAADAESRHSQRGCALGRP